ANVATLSERGVHVVPPASGRLTGRDTGPGRLPEPEELFAVCERELARASASAGRTTAPLRGDLAARRVVVSAGGTREPLDPVRYLGNRSSGKQGYALARAAAERGAEVTLVSSSSLPAPGGVTVVPVETALELQAAVADAAGDADVIVMAAAVADFRPATYADHKLKKTHVAGADGAADESAPTVALVRNPDVLAGLVTARGSESSPVIVGFAAETGDGEGSVLDHARAKLARKGCDLLVVNEVGVDKTFGHDHSTVHLLRRGSDDATQVGPASKLEVAHAVWDAVLPLL
ncbi:MAG TPA: phosphopantothenoylcysteine decarboxylase, partial [Ornithinibacter sp.]|nr:phosphopantothenoylcysteine decarboxylase [Ornithinibacter sp.]